MIVWLKMVFNLIVLSLILLTSSCKSTSELYLIEKNGKWGYINRKGKVVVEPIFESCCYQRYEDSCCSRIIWPEKLGIVKLDGKYGAIDHSGKLVIKNWYDFLDQYHNSLIIAKSRNKFGVLSAKGDTIFPFIFDNQFISCNSNIGHGQIDGEYYLLNFATGAKTKTNFDKISYFVENKAIIKKGGQFGFIDTLGNIIIEPKFQNAWPFNKGLAAVKTNYQWGVIDAKGKFIIEPKFDETEGLDLFSGEYAIVVKNKKYGLIDKSGEYIIPPKYEYLYFEGENILQASLYDKNILKTGLINLNQNWVYIADNKSFDYLLGYLKFESNNKFGLMKLSNKKQILPPIFDEIAFRPKGLSLLSYYDPKTTKFSFAYVNKRGKIVWEGKESKVAQLLKKAD